MYTSLLAKSSTLLLKRIHHLKLKMGKFSAATSSRFMQIQQQTNVETVQFSTSDVSTGLEITKKKKMLLKILRLFIMTSKWNSALMRLKMLFTAAQVFRTKRQRLTSSLVNKIQQLHSSRTAHVPSLKPCPYFWISSSSERCDPCRRFRNFSNAAI